VPSTGRRVHRNREPMMRNRELKVRGKNIGSQREGNSAQD
jgi:hypothetical protein